MRGEFTPEKGNLALMLADATEALRIVTERGDPNVLQTGILIGLKAAAHAFEGYTADEAWEAVRPHIQLVHRGGRDE